MAIFRFLSVYKDSEFRLIHFLNGEIQKYMINKLDKKDKIMSNDIK